MLEPTPEQQAIIDFAKNESRSILINALAGSAKTTTLVMIANALPVQPVLSLAFNKKIAEEMSERLPSHATCRTMNSIGHRIWATACAKRITINPRKNYEILKANVEGLGKAERKEAYESFSGTLRALTTAKRVGYIPKGKFSHAKALAEEGGFFEELEEEPTQAQKALISQSLCDSISCAYSGELDYDDQLYMPTLFGGSFPRFPLVLVDEAQDLSPINHAMLRKLVTSRIIAVGDPYQSIYGFRGAVQGGMASLRSTFDCQEFTLSRSFRCPQAIVRAARFRVPHMNWHRQGGRVERLSSLSIEDIPEGATFLCRNNAPLFSLALRLLTAGRGCNLVGSDLGPGLVKTLKKLGPPELSQKEALHAIEQWKVERLAKAKDKHAVEDKAECLRVFVEFGETLGGAIAYCEGIFKSKGTIQLLSIHKAKGLEWNTVYHLDPWRIPSAYAETKEALAQEWNLKYVAITRAKEAYFEIDSGDIRDGASHRDSNRDNTSNNDVGANVRLHQTSTVEG